ncbi:MAG: cupin domain-containing protein, partial [Gammaproteobacteria bacterium]|nr:cupin domain-containing protein [Gammaproteobacteria bacterium]
LEWLRLRPGDASGAWQTERAQVAIVFDGAVDAVLNPPASQVTVGLAARSIFSAPRGVMRAFHNRGDGDAVMLLINGGDARLIPQWDDAALAAARAAGQMLDADARWSPAAVVNPSAAAATDSDAATAANTANASTAA